MNGNNWYPRIQLLRGYSFGLAAVFCSEFCLACGRSISFRVFRASEGKRTRRPEISLCPQAIFERDTRAIVEGARNKRPLREHLALAFGRLKNLEKITPVQILRLTRDQNSLPPRPL